MKNLLLLTAIAISLNSFGQIPPNIPSNGLIGWWPFNGNANDESGNLNNGTINGAVLTNDRASTSNSAFHFNGISNFISLASVPQTSIDSITLSCWMRATSLNQFGMAICYGQDSGSVPVDGIQFGLTGNISPCSTLTGNEVSFIHSGVACASTGYLFSDTLTWHNVILEHKNSITKIFVDANLVYTQTLATISPVTQFTIGSATDIRFFEGDIDDVGVWNRTLTAFEIQNIYDSSALGIIENDFGNELLLYPNPTDGNFSIDLGYNYQTIDLTMTDLSGKLILSNTYNESQLLNLKLEEPTGVYLLIIESGDKKAVIRLIKK